MGRFLSRLSEKVTPLLLASVALGVLLITHGLVRALRFRTLDLQAPAAVLEQMLVQHTQVLAHFRSLADLKTNDVNQLKEGMSSLAQINKSLFEAGLSLHEEKRLLEKQWEIITTYLTLNTELQRVFLMHGDQPLESYLINYVPLKVFGSLPVTVPRIVRIVSKERFANPDRGSSEMVNGKLQWVPPQVGTSARSKALGEYVMFTNSRLILHGPPLNSVDHEAFPHLCLGLSREAARNLYRHSFIGTKILLGSARETILQPIIPFSIVVPVSTGQGPHGY